ncbi:hypothetical protein [Stieleria mannarensis]|uniref:hypothetical protein n=1 Tax=Stieleria mannarensis TaxID=2755585 RepID=UPI0016034CDB|nr:hypothetical protein [Rhodopirellula sp. JC639]
MQRPVHNQCCPHTNDTGSEPWQLPTPTLAIPGTPEKLAVMQARFRAGEQLHHPFDRKAFPHPASLHLHHLSTNRETAASIEGPPTQTDSSREPDR